MVNQLVVDRTLLAPEVVDRDPLAVAAASDCSNPLLSPLVQLMLTSHETSSRHMASEAGVQCLKQANVVNCQMTSWSLVS